MPIRLLLSQGKYTGRAEGMWIQFLVMFLTPFYWFTTFFFRWVRLTTIGDFFTDWFRSKFLGAFYAVFIILISIMGGGVGYLVAAKTIMAMTLKPIEACTLEERTSIEQFHEFQELKSKYNEGLAPPMELETGPKGETYPMFYAYCPALDQFVFSWLNKSIYPDDYLTANLNYLKENARLARNNRRKGGGGGWIGTKLFFYLNPVPA